MTSPTTEAGRPLDVDTFLAGLDSPNHSEQSRRDWVRLFFRDMRAEAEARAGLDVLRERAEYVVREYDKTSLTHDTAYESVAEGIDWLRIALDPTHPLYAALARQEAPRG